jgi:hypothetical protein
MKYAFFSCQGHIERELSGVTTELSVLDTQEKDMQSTILQVLDEEESQVVS